MAKAKLHRQNTPRTFNVRLTEGEVDFILGVCGRIGGDPDSSPRKYARRLRKALSKVAGYDYNDTDAHALAGYNGNGEYITFRSYDGSPSAADEIGLTEDVQEMASLLRLMYPQPALDIEGPPSEETQLELFGW